jgi:hypothetical protein
MPPGRRSAIPQHWYRNIEDDPHVTVEVTGASGDAVAEILDGDERADAASGMPMASHAERARLNVTRAIEPDARLPIPQLGSWVLSSGS